MCLPYVVSYNCSVTHLISNVIFGTFLLSSFAERETSKLKIFFCLVNHLIPRIMTIALKTFVRNQMFLIHFVGKRVNIKSDVGQFCSKKYFPFLIIASSIEVGPVHLACTHQPDYQQQSLRYLTQAWSIRHSREFFTMCFKII